MKVAFTSSGDTLDSAFDSRFGRAEKFIIYDMENETFMVIDNGQNFQAAQGAGIQSAQHVVASGAHALVTGHLGPKAAKVIFAAGIAAYHADAKTVGEAVSMYKSKALKPMRDADVEGHWV
ncbi:MAG: NifB/NifX family molybdenum-iron cluster-binding protein [Sphaerochaetaceae bacterium]